jgi:hypothetical protein
VLGDTAPPGDIEWAESVTLDSLGRYWVGQRGVVKVFDSTGRFLQVVGRPGRGPMEFVRPQPLYADDSARVHILDPANLRETVIGPGVLLHTERPIPTPWGRAVHIQGAERLVLNAMVQTANLFGQPLHVVEGSRILHSFGVPEVEGSPPINPFNSRRVLAVGAEHYVFSAPYYDYLVEAWTETGRRITGFSGPALNDKPPVPGAFTPENPPPAQIWAMQLDDAGRLWVAIVDPKDDWRDRMSEVVLPDGDIRLQPAKEDPRFLANGRIDVIDLNRAAIIASAQTEQILTAFVGDGLGVEFRDPDEGTPHLIMWRLRLASDGGRGQP